MNNDNSNLDLTHKVRESIYLKIKDMSTDEMVNHIKNESKKLNIPHEESRKRTSVKDYLRTLDKKAS